MFFLSSTSVLLGVLGFLFCLWFVRRPKNLPPGPWSLPIIGYRFDSGLIHEAFVDLARKYGPVFSVRRGPFLFVVLNDRASMKQALVKSGEFFSDRFVPGHIRWGIPDAEKNAAIVWSNGKPWDDQRKFSLPALRSFGFGKKSLVPQINLEARYLAEEIKALHGEPMDPSALLNKATANIIVQLVFGRRYEYDDPEFIGAMQAMVDIFSLVSDTDPVNVFESLVHTPWYKPYRDCTFKLRDFIMSHLYNHQETFQKDNIRDFVDAFLAHDISKDYSMDTFWRIVLDFFAAGTETTAVVTSWAILYLAVYPDVQKKVQSELDAVVGRGRQPNTSDRPNLPYCDATLMEVMRIRPVLPVALPHMTSADVSIGPYTIPKGTIVIPNLWAVHHDPKEWCDPQLFNSDRFLSADGQTVVKNEAWMPFSIGRRDCLGVQLAKMESFLLFTNLFQQFEFKLPPDQPTHSMRGHPGLSMPPESYKICAIER
ncbi:cytochrome P450 2J2-like [Strongylocentrotus purpuratus]|uniref:Cytochrome P450 n=1 Tax=Strongylocentrotus purpuratus TaxID=7668 RepID=A0A7M7G178_STRPU|nr:cytochrome P450 2J2-like [Strongylocentrotus purpuratus]